MKTLSIKTVGLLAMLLIVAVVFFISPNAYTAGLFALPLFGMAMGATSGISKAAKCTAPITTAYTFATPGADDDTFSVASAATNPLIGVFQGTTINAGDTVETMISGISNIVLGGNVTRGQEVTSDANGKAVAVTSYPPGTGIWSGGIALKSGVAGDIITIHLESDFLVPMAAGAITRPMVATGGVVALADAAATLTAAQMQNSGVFKITPTANRNLTTDTAANLVAGMPGCQVGTTFDFTVACLAAFTATLVAGNGVNVVGSAVANNASATFRAIFTNVTAGTEAVTIVSMATGFITPAVPATKAIVALADAPATLTAAQMESGGIFTITPGAARALTTDTAANLVAGIVGCQVGTTFEFTIACLAAYAVTLTSPGAPVTLVGSAVANNASATFRAVFTNVTGGTEAVTIVRM